MNLRAILEKWNIKADVNLLLDMWNESHRHYHSLNHLNDLINQIREYYSTSNCSEKEYEKLLITAMFHDIVYDPMKNDNEEQSANFFYNCCESKNADIEEIKNAILNTKSHFSSSPFSQKFNEFDMKIVERNFEQLLEWEKGIFEEYKEHGIESYKSGRLKFLENLLDQYPNNSSNLSDLIQWVKTNY